MKILVDTEELQKVLDELTYNQSGGIRNTINKLKTILDKNYKEEWVVVEPRPQVDMDITKTGFDKYSVSGTFNIINFFANKEDAEREAAKSKNYATCMVVKAMSIYKLVSRKQLAELRYLIFSLEYSALTPESSDKLKRAHQLVYEMQNQYEENK